MRFGPTEQRYARGVDLDGRVLTRADLSTVASRYGWTVVEIRSSRTDADELLLTVCVAASAGFSFRSTVEELESNLRTMIPIQYDIAVREEIVRAGPFR